MWYQQKRWMVHRLPLQRIDATQEWLKWNRGLFKQVRMAYLAQCVSPYSLRASWKCGVQVYVIWMSRADVFHTRIIWNMLAVQGGDVGMHLGKQCSPLSPGSPLTPRLSARNHMHVADLSFSCLLFYKISRKTNWFTVTISCVMSTRLCTPNTRGTHSLQALQVLANITTLYMCAHHTLGSSGKPLSLHRGHTSSG